MIGSFWKSIVGSEVHMFQRRNRSSALATMFAILFSATAPAGAQSRVAVTPEVVPLIGHTAKIAGVVFSPDESIVASGAGDGLAKLWDVGTGRLIRTFDGHKDGVTTLVFSPDGRILATDSGSSSALRLWDVASGRLLHTIAGTTASPHSVAFSPDSRKLAVGLKEGETLVSRIAVLDVETARESYRLAGSVEELAAIAFSPDGRYVAAAGASGTNPGRRLPLNVWETDTGRLARRNDQVKGQGVADLAFTPDGTRLVLIAHGGAILQFAVQSLAAIGNLPIPESSAGGSLTSDGRLAATAGDVRQQLDIARLYEVTTGRLLARIDFPKDWPGGSAVAASSSGRHLAVAESNDLTLYDTATRRMVRRIKSGSDRGVEMALGSQGSSIMVLGRGPLTRWDLATGRVDVTRLPTNAYQKGNIHIAADGSRISYLMYGFQAGMGMRILQLASGKIVELNPQGSDGDINDAYFSADGRWVTNLPLAFSGDGRRFAAPANAVLRWDASTGAPLAPFGSGAGQTPPVRRKGGGSSALNIFDAATGKVLQALEVAYAAPQNFAFAPDGRWLIGGSFGRGKYRQGDGTVTLWDANSGRQAWSTSGHDDGLTHLDFAPDGSFALTAGWDGKVKLWAPASGKLLRTFDTGGEVATTAAVAPDGSLIASASGRFPSRAVTFSQDRTAKVDLWEPQTGTLRCSLKGHDHWIKHIRFTADGRRIVTGSEDGTARVWATAGCELLATLHTDGNGDWLIITPEGFFVPSSPRGAELLTVVNGTRLTGIDQIYQMLFNPDLVREKLLLDPDGEVKSAAAVLDLGRVLASGAPPEANIVVLPAGNVSPGEVVTIEAAVTDKGGGVGRVEWRLNGVTVAVATKPSGNGPSYPIKQQIALEPGDNTIELVAYNASNLVMSPPARATVRFTGPADPVKPTLHVLAIGINSYVDQGWTPPGGTQPVKFPPLGLAAKDATDFAAALRQAGAGQYSDVRVTHALDAGATVAGLVARTG